MSVDLVHLDGGALQELRGGTLCVTMRANTFFARMTVNKKLGEQIDKMLPLLRTYLAETNLFFSLIGYKISRAVENG